MAEEYFGGPWYAFTATVISEVTASLHTYIHTYQHLYEAPFPQGYKAPTEDATKKEIQTQDVPM